jgi:hypothetical protein
MSIWSELRGNTSENILHSRQNKLERGRGGGDEVEEGKEEEEEETYK